MVSNLPKVNTFSPDHATDNRTGVSCIIFIFLVAIIFVAPESGLAGPTQTAGQSNSNISVLQSIVEKIAGIFIAKSNINPADSVTIQVEGSPESWITEQAVTSKLKSSGCIVFLDRDKSTYQKIIVKITTAAYSISYTDMFRDGFLGTRKAKRVASANIGIEAYNRNTNEILFSGLLKEQSADTVAVDDIPNLELASAPSTHCELPNETFIDRVIEPFIIIGATGAAVYLFFYVRTK